MYKVCEKETDRIKGARREVAEKGRGDWGPPIRSLTDTSSRQIGKLFLITKTTLLWKKNTKDCSTSNVWKLKTHSIYSYRPFSIQLWASVCSIMIGRGTRLRGKRVERVEYMVVLLVYIPREHYHVNGSYCTVKTPLLQVAAAEPQRGRDVSCA